MARPSWVAWVLSALLLAVCAIGAQAQQPEPTVDQIYQTARSGQLPQARGMIDQVVRSHPASAKAHYVRAEIASRQGDTGVARQELAQAEQLAPGLPFVKPEAVQALRAQLQAADSATASRSNTARMGGPADPEVSRAPADASMPWGKLLLGAAIVLGIMALLRRRRAGYAGNMASPTAGPVVSSGGMPAPGAQPGMHPPGAYPPGAYPPGAGPGPGLGSRMGSGLATGLAVGAGALAAHEIGSRILHGRDGQPLDPGQGAAAGGGWPDLGRFDGNADMGGQDFGLRDTGSWDDGGAGLDAGSGGGDWDDS